MREITVDEFQRDLESFVDAAIEEQVPLRIARRTGRDFIVMGVDDWEREQETLYVLQNQTLMQQLALSLSTQRST